MPANTRRLGFCMFLVATAALHAEIMMENEKDIKHSVK